MLRYLRRRPELGALLLLCAGLAAAWALVVPPFESPDEPAHWSYVAYLADEGELPSEIWPQTAEWRPELYESHQPPLFYATAASLLRATGLPTEHVEPPRNPEFRTAPDEPNLFLRPRGGSALGEATVGIGAVRLLSAAFGVGAALLAYLLADLVFGGRRPHALAVAALVGLSPQFLHIAGSVNNDGLTALLSTATLLATVRLLREPAAGPWLPALLGGLLGAALLAKLTALALLPIAAGVVLWRALRPRRRPLHLLAFAGALLAVAGWYVARNVVLWRDPFLLRLAEANTPSLIDRKGLASDYWLDRFAGRFFESFWGYFGWFSVAFPTGVYRTLVVLLVLAAAGLVAGFLGRNRGGAGFPAARRRPLLLLAAAVGANLAAVVQYNLTYSQPQGRFLFPSIAAVAVLLVAGWGALASLVAARLPPGRLRAALPGLLAGAVVAGMVALNLSALRLVADAYRAAGSPL
jgi:4-amino-4-deoxy-L-arabinose transferase-like glycosyltransferase